jgi:hypothetical protein
MIRAASLLVIAFLLLLSGISAHAAEGASLERGTAITDPLALRELDRGRFGLGRMLLPERSADIPLANATLFALPSMVPVQQAIDREFEVYIERHRKNLSAETVGVGDGFDFQLFDRTQLYSPDTRFVLAGIVNRMDRTFLDEVGCGEIRLIYRLTKARGSEENAQRLPAMLNLVLSVKGDRASEMKIACAEIARRWLALGSESATGADLVAKLLTKDGPLDLIGTENLELIETNLQIAHAPKSAVRDFRTDYLLKVFRYDTNAKRFEEAPLENQIDRERILADENLKRDFKAWVLQPRHFAQLDGGTLLLPEQFLAKGAIAATPVGFAPSNLQPAFGLTEGEGANPVFTANDVVSALKKAANSGVVLQNIRSVAGFARRLNDLTCSGCHQTRGIGGFHFPGVDWMAQKPSNSTVVPASPHFLGDQVRRRDILNAIASGKNPDYSRGFSSRPQLRGNTELAGTEYNDGWGAHCYRQRGKVADNDASFRSWTCAKGLACQVTGENRMGMCFVETR